MSIRKVSLGVGAQGHERLIVDDREIAVSNPSKVLFPRAGITKLDLVRYYLTVADGALRGAGGRPNVLVRYPNGIEGEFFFQKRAPQSRPPWVEVVALSFPSGRTAEEVVPRDAATLAWMANLACLELHPHPVRAEDLDHPDELRIDLDPVPGVTWNDIRTVAGLVRTALADFGLVGWPKTSGSRGMHIYVRIEQKWTFPQVRRAALAFAREVERRAPGSGDEQVVEGRAAGRLPRLQPERQGPDDRRRLLGAADARRARVGTALVGRDRRLRTRRLHAGDDAGAIQRRRRSTCGNRRAAAARSTRCSSFLLVTSVRARATRRGRRSTASSQENRRACSRRAAASRTARSSKLAAPNEKRTRWRGWNGGGHGTQRRHRTSSQQTCSSTRCAAASARGRGSASTCSTCPSICGRRRSHSIPMRRRMSGKASVRTARRAEDLLELVRRSDLELIVAAVSRLSIGTPAQEDGGVSEPIALQVVVLDLADALDPHRLPRKILAGTPSALSAGHPATRVAGGSAHSRHG